MSMCDCHISEKSNSREEIVLSFFHKWGYFNIFKFGGLIIYGSDEYDMDKGSLTFCVNKEGHTIMKKRLRIYKLGESRILDF